MDALKIVANPKLTVCAKSYCFKFEYKICRYRKSRKSFLNLTL